MQDSFLHAHQLSPRFFSAGGKLYPISLRDQMLRGKILVDRAIEQGLVVPGEERGLLVVGAGATGVSAALRAAELDVRVLVIERTDKEACWVQAECPTRWLNPTFYDYPARHWEEHVYPHPAVLSPLAWRAGWAHTVSLEWRRAFDSVRRQLPADRFEFRKNTKLLAPPQLDPNGDFLTVSLETTDPLTHAPLAKQSEKVAAIILATGYGTEKCYLRHPGQLPEAARGYAFWQEDPYGEADYGLKPGQNPVILISGSGDGALQDFLRVLVQPRSFTINGESVDCRTSQGILAYLFQDGPPPPEFLHYFHCVQDFAQRQLIWGQTTHHDHPVLDHLQEEHRALIFRLGTTGQLARVEARLEQILRRPQPVVHFVYDSNHFSMCYGLNRFLALLLTNYLESNGNLHLYDHRRVLRIECLPPHSCCGDADDCHGHFHQVTLGTVSDCRAATGAVAESFSANILILRHGVDLADLPFDPTPPQFRQLLPYGLHT